MWLPQHFAPPAVKAETPRAALAAVLLLFLTGCDGPQSILDPAGSGAARVAELFWWLAAGGIITWLVVIGLAVYAIRVDPAVHSRRLAALFIIGGGAAVPTVVLAGYLIYGLALLPNLLEPAPEGSVVVSVSGEQWWWRVQYRTAAGDTIDLANEIHLPVGEKTTLLLESPDVVHSFWVPSLGGKIDMVPGRVNRLTLEPTKTGVFRGACAEYCGSSHAYMNFHVVVEERESFERWLEHQAAPAPSPENPLAAQGGDYFLSNGCGACHSVRGTAAAGVVGPDLTHVGSRVSLAAGVMDNEREQFRRWIARTDHIKPGVLMPAFGMLPDAQLRALAAYLDGLE